MNKRITANNLKIVAIPLLAILLLFGPCSLRNYLQTTIGIETTKPLNPNKTTNTPTHCGIWDNVTEKTISSRKLTQKKLLQSATKHAVVFIPIDKEKSQILKLCGFSQKLPYYILFKRLKIYDLNHFQSV